MVANLIDYQYSSYLEYIRGGQLADTKLALEMIGKNDWERFHQSFEEESFELFDKIKISNEGINHEILRFTGGREPYEIGSWSKVERDNILRQLREKAGLSIRQIERATGISRGIIAKC